jgi:hypothetical protein
MPVAPDRWALKRRLDRFFVTNRAGEMTALRTVLAARFQDFHRVAVIGGLVRDFAREGRTGFRSDVDLVIEAPAAKVQELAVELQAIPNRFGGYGFRDGPWRIDFWAMETTWAARHAGVRLTHLEDVLRCTFFDWDAAAYDLRTHRVMCSDDYLERLRLGVLDINLLESPSPKGNLLRAIRRLVLWRARPGPALRAFIEQHLNEATFRELQAYEQQQRHLHLVMPRWADARTASHALLEPIYPELKPAQHNLPLPV